MHMLLPVALWMAAASGQDCSPQETVTFTAEMPAAADIVGAKLAVDGSFAIAGAPNDDELAGNAGAAYIFERVVTADGSADWVQRAKLFAPDGDTEDRFSREGVTISGDTVAVAALRHDGQCPGVNNCDSGAVYVFRRGPDGTWPLEAKVEPDDAEIYARFGASLHLQGDTLVVGRIADHSPATNAGSVYVFERTGTVWTQQAKIQPLDTAGGLRFGTSVAIDGDRIAVGAMESFIGPGAVYVFERIGDDWVEQARLTAPDGVDDDRLGGRVSFGRSADRSMIVTGAVFHAALAEDSGAAYVFTLDDGSWGFEQKFAEGDSDPFHDNFGDELVAGDDRLYVCTDRDDTLGANTGTVYGYERTGGREPWTLQSMVFPADVMHSDSFGIAVALDGNVLLVTREGANRVPSSGGAIIAFIADPCSCPDPTGDGTVGITDFLAVLAAWGPCVSCAADFDDDGFVGITDLLMLLAAWGPC